MATEKELRKKVVSIAESYLGVKAGSKEHEAIIKTYNRINPPGNYDMKLTDEWCQGFASVVGYEAGLSDIIPIECSCGRAIELWQELGSWKETDSYVPDLGDYLYYDWHDSGVGDNKGWPDHVGIVSAVSGSNITVIEGNKSDAVAKRLITINAKYIRGYGLPNYASKATKEPEPAQSLDKNLAGTYKTTADLNLRTGAGINKEVITVMPKGESVRNYGYYTEVSGTKWLLVVYNDLTGFSSEQYLAKI